MDSWVKWLKEVTGMTPLRQPNGFDFLVLSGKTLDDEIMMRVKRIEEGGVTKDIYQSSNGGLSLSIEREGDGKEGHWHFHSYGQGRCTFKGRDITFISPEGKYDPNKPGPIEAGACLAESGTICRTLREAIIKTGVDPDQQVQR